jgi:hypothetical protein
MRGNLAKKSIPFVHNLQNARGHQGLLGGRGMVHPAQQVFPAQTVQVRAVGETYLMGQDQEFIFALGS